MEQHVFAFSLVTEGNPEQVLQFIMPLKSNYNRLCFSLNKKVPLITTESFMHNTIN